MNFVVTAMDYTDSDAINRRMACREQHIEGLKALAKSGRLKSAGAVLDDQGKMVGTSAHVEFPSRQDLEQHLASDAYSTGRVWEKLDTREIRLFEPGT